MNSLFSTHNISFRKIFLYRFSVFLLLMGVIFLLVWYSVTKQQHELSKVKLIFQQDKLRMTSLSGNIVITHLRGRTNNSLVYAKLPEPHLFLDSFVFEMTKEEISHLHWLNEAQEKVLPPQDFSQITALYYSLESSTKE